VNCQTALPIFESLKGSLGREVDNGSIYLAQKEEARPVGYTRQPMW